MRAWIGNTFALSPVRVRSFSRSALFFFSFVGGVTTFKSATNALFLSRRNPADLPYLYLVTALAVAAVTILVGRSLGKYSAKPILRNAISFSALLLAALSLLAVFDVPFAFGALYVAGEVYATTLSVLFWARLAEVFDVREGKRVFGAIAALGMVGAVAGGSVVRVFAHVVPAEFWCFAAPLSLVVAKPLLGRARGFGALRRQPLHLREELRHFSDSAFVRSVAILVLLLAVQTAVVDYAFRTAAVSYERGDEGALAGLFGVLNVVVGVVAIAFQLLLTGTLLRRAGIFVFLALVPLAGLSATAWAFVVPTAFAPLFVLKVVEMLGSLSLNQPAIQLLYSPMPDSVRDAVRAFVDGAVKKLGGALGGVALLALGVTLEGREALGLVALLALVVLVWLRVVRVRYLRALEAKLGRKESAKTFHLEIGDRSSVLMLERELMRDDPGRVLAALEVLARHAKDRLAAHLGRLLEHHHEEVRARAIEWMAAVPDPAYARALVSTLREDSSARLRMHAALALERVDRPCAARELAPLLLEPTNMPDIGLVCAAIHAHLGATADASPREVRAPARLAEARLEELLERSADATVAERSEIARLLGRIGDGNHARSLERFFDDSSFEVRRVALEAAGRMRDETLLGPLLGTLETRGLEQAAARALGAYGDRATPFLASSLDDRRLGVAVRARIPGVLRRIGTDAAASALLFSNVHDDASLRQIIVRELIRLHRERPDIAFDRERTEAAALRRLRAHVHYRSIAIDLESDVPSARVLERAVRDRSVQNLHAALHVLGLYYDMDAMADAFRGFRRGSVADAIELVDEALSGSDARAEVVRMLETPPSERPTGSLEILRARCFELARGKDVPLALIARETLWKLGEYPSEIREPSEGEPIMSKTIIERVFLLESVQLFRNLTVDDLTAVAELAREGHASPRGTIYREGDAGDSMYVIVAGEVRLFRGGESVMDLSTGDSFGQVSILDRGPRPVTATAGDDGADYLELDRGPFLDLMADRPDVMKGLFVVLARRLRELLERTDTHTLSESSSSRPARDGDERSR